MKPRTSSGLPIAAILLGATSWGVIWFPFRAVEAGGLPSPVATVLAYFVSTLLGGLVLRHAWREFPANARWLLAIGLTAGITNVAYLVAIMQAEVVRIVLLFYLAPLWTVPLSRLILRERLTGKGYAVMALAMAGALVMLWHPERGAPAPRNGFEWLGLVAGLSFAACNVFVKAATGASAEAKSLAGTLGVLLVALPVAVVAVPAVGTWPAMAGPHVLLLVILGVTLTATSLALQFGLTHLSANRAAVLMLFELIVAAAAAHFLAGEVTRAQDWLGGAMIVGAGVFATLAEQRRLAAQSVRPRIG